MSQNDSLANIVNAAGSLTDDIGDIGYIFVSDKRRKKNFP